MISLLAFGCPVQAIVGTFKVDERTVADWERESGKHCQDVHQVLVQNGQQDLFQVQADEIRVKAQGIITWMALAIAVPTRLWLGGVVTKSRNSAMAVVLAGQIKACAFCHPLLICFDGFAGYVKAFQQTFRIPFPTGKRGCPRLISWPNIILAQVIKQYANRCVVGVKRCIVQGSEAIVADLIKKSQGKGVINTAFIERLYATFRARMNTLARRSRSLARTIDKLDAGMYIVGCIYNFCTWHQSLRVPLYLGANAKRRWVKRTPAMAAKLTNHQWSVLELLSCKIFTNTSKDGAQLIKTAPLIQLA